MNFNAPLLGEPVHYMPASNHPQFHLAPFAAIVTRVHGSLRFVNLQIFLPEKCSDNPPDGQAVPFISHQDEPRSEGAEFCFRPGSMLTDPPATPSEPQSEMTLPSPQLHFEGESSPPEPPPAPPVETPPAPEPAAPETTVDPVTEPVTPPPSDETSEKPTE